MLACEFVTKYGACQEEIRDDFERGGVKRKLLLTNVRLNCESERSHQLQGIRVQL